METTVRCFDFESLDDAAVQGLLAEFGISLSITDARKVQQLLDRPPTLSECILWSIQGSEHCSYKSTRHHLKTLPTDGPNVILGAKEDAGIVRIATDQSGINYGIVISHESHNHPSQIVPFEGAATGIGGNVRDVCCMGAKVIANADSLRFGQYDRHKTQWIKDGVVEGIASYSNAIGVPNIAGDIYFHEGFDDNCLVTAVTLGVIREDQILHSYAPENADGHDLILVGKPTDNSGFGGASFASLELEEDDKDKNRGAVQEPNAFLGRMMMKSNYALFEKLKNRNLLQKVGFKDLGAGGVACASVELAETAGFGAEVYIENIPTSMQNLHPSVILCSETQERYMWVCPPELTPEILDHYNEAYDLPNISEGACAAVVGKVRADGRYIVKHFDEVHIDAKASDVTKGIMYERQTESTNCEYPPIEHFEMDLENIIYQFVNHENLASQKPIFEQYDKQVQGRTLIERGRADAGVMQPFNSDEYPEEIQQIGIALSVAANPRYGRIDAKIGTQLAVLEATQKIIATGAIPECLTDCLCFGNPEKPAQMHELVSAIEGLKEACGALKLFDFPDAPLPVIAGNVSLYNESQSGAIPPSPMISCLGRLESIDFAMTPALKSAGSKLLFVGESVNSLDGSLYASLNQQTGNTLGAPDLAMHRQLNETIYQLIKNKKLHAVKTCSAGGILMAILKMAFLSDYQDCGVKCNTTILEQNFHLKEHRGYVLEVPDSAAVSTLSEAGFAVVELGEVTSKKLFQLDTCCFEIANLKEDWENALRRAA